MAVPRSAARYYIRRLSLAPRITLSNSFPRLLEAVPQLARVIPRDAHPISRSRDSPGRPAGAVPPREAGYQPSWSEAASATRCWDSSPRTSTSPPTRCRRTSGACSATAAWSGAAAWRTRPLRARDHRGGDLQGLHRARRGRGSPSPKARRTDARRWPLADEPDLEDDLDAGDEADFDDEDDDGQDGPEAGATPEPGPPSRSTAAATRPQFPAPDARDDGEAGGGSSTSTAGSCDNVYGTIDGTSGGATSPPTRSYYNIADFSVWGLRGRLRGRAGAPPQADRRPGDPTARIRYACCARRASRRSSVQLSLTRRPREPIGAFASPLAGVPAARLFDETLKLFLTGHGTSSLARRARPARGVAAERRSLPREVPAALS